VAVVVADATHFGDVDRGRLREAVVAGGVRRR
jgi:hypothetical protein